MPFTDWLNNTLQSSAFLTIGIIFFVILLIALFLDGIFEALDFGDGPLSLTTIGAFGAMFGFVGFAAKEFNASTEFAVLLGLGCGLAGAVGAWFLSGLFKKSSSSVSISTSTLVGTEAIVSLSIPEGRGAGEISFSAKGMQNVLTAFASEEIPSGTVVTITHIRGENSVIVERKKEETPESSSNSGSESAAVPTLVTAPETFDEHPESSADVSSESSSSSGGDSSGGGDGGGGGGD